MLNLQPSQAIESPTVGSSVADLILRVLLNLQPSQNYIPSNQQHFIQGDAQQHDPGMPGCSTNPDQINRPTTSSKKAQRSFDDDAENRLLSTPLNSRQSLNDSVSMAMVQLHGQNNPNKRHPGVAGTKHTAQDLCCDALKRKLDYSKCVMPKQRRVHNISHISNEADGAAHNVNDIATNCTVFGIAGQGIITNPNTSAGDHTADPSVNYTEPAKFKRTYRAPRRRSKFNKFAPIRQTEIILIPDTPENHITGIQYRPSDDSLINGINAQEFFTPDVELTTHDTKNSIDENAASVSGIPAVFTTGSLEIMLHSVDPTESVSVTPSGRDTPGVDTQQENAKQLDTEGDIQYLCINSTGLFGYQFHGKKKLKTWLNSGRK